MSPAAGTGNPLENQPNSHADADRRSAGRSSPPDLTSDLARLVERWPLLPVHIKAAVMALANVGGSPSPSSSTTTANGLDDAVPPGFEQQQAKGGQS